MALCLVLLTVREVPGKTGEKGAAPDTASVDSWWARLLARAASKPAGDPGKVDELAEHPLSLGQVYLAASAQSDPPAEPPLPPTRFNPDPGGVSEAAPVEPPALFQPEYSALPEYGREAVPRSLGLPRKDVRELRPLYPKYEYPRYPLAQEGEGLQPNSEPVDNRWFVGFGRWKRYADPSTETTYQAGEVKLWHPYLRSTLKGDAPIIGQDIFLDLTVIDFAQLEARRLPTGSGVSAAKPNSSEFFGRSEQVFFSNDFSLAIDLFKGETAFKPVEYALRILAVANYNYINVKENNVVDPDPRGPEFGPITKPPLNIGVFNPGSGNTLIAPGLHHASGDFSGRRYTTREKEFFSLQEAFGEIHIHDLSNNYDFISSRFGIQPFVSDFRGFIFDDSNLGARIFGNLDNNKLQYNFIAFDMREKDTYSGLNKFDSRHQKILIANVFRQDFFAHGYTAQLSVHANFDGASRHYDQNEFITRPAPIGNVKDHSVTSYYLGWTGDGHIGPLNLTHAFYQVFGEDSFNGIAGRRVDINAQMAALELALDKDWLRYSFSLFYASGDDNPKDSHANGFDTIFDRPFFIGGPFSYYVHQGINLGGTSVNLKQGESLVADLRTSKSEGQSNFVNPGVGIIGVGLQADVTPKLKAFANANYISFVDTAVLKEVLFTNHASNDFGYDLSFGLQYRPLLTDNIIFSLGAGFLLPGQGYKDIYRTNTRHVPGFDNHVTPGRVDDFLYSSILTLTLTY